MIIDRDRSGKGVLEMVKSFQFRTIEKTQLFFRTEGVVDLVFFTRYSL